jgi:hypothetical protein
MDRLKHRWMRAQLGFETFTVLVPSIPSTCHVGRRLSRLAALQRGQAAE